MRYLGSWPGHSPSAVQRQRTFWAHGTWPDLEQTVGKRQREPCAGPLAPQLMAAEGSDNAHS